MTDERPKFGPMVKSGFAGLPARKGKRDAESKKGNGQGPLERKRRREKKRRSFRVKKKEEQFGSKWRLREVGTIRRWREGESPLAGPKSCFYFTLCVAKRMGLGLASWSIISPRCRAGAEGKVAPSCGGAHEEN